jgi:mono/diheme cytochrome c family protein
VRPILDRSLLAVASAALAGAASLIVVAGAAGRGPGPSSVEGQAAATPTFTKDIAPVLFKNCATCHRPGGIGPMSLLSYDDAREHAYEIGEKVAAGQMPPWHADPAHGRFLNDRRLTDAEKQTIARWVAGGAPRGNASDLPPLPVFPAGWTIGTPDAIVGMAADYEVPANGTIEYQYFEIPTGFTEEKWVQAIEILPGAREVVHHVLVYAREPGAAQRPPVLRPRADLGLPPPVPGPDGQLPPRRQLGALIATTAPGTSAMRFPEGTALRVGPGSILTFQMHYTAHGKAMKDRTRVGFVFAKQPPAEEIRASSFINGRFVIPAGARDHRVDAEIGFNESVRVWALFPHTHLRGKRWEYKLVQADGRSEVILSVPRYDFNWQTYYIFAEPLAIPATARITSAAWYDNSADNPSNPDARAEVRWGDQTWEEMQYTGFLYTVDSRRR